MSEGAFLEIFYKLPEVSQAKFGRLNITFQAVLIRERDSKYHATINKEGDPLDACVVFINGTNIYTYQKS